MNVEQVIYNYFNTWVLTMNCGSKSEGHREVIQGFQNFSKHGPTDRTADRQDIKKSECENRTLIYLSGTVQFISFNCSWTIQQSISNNRPGMRHTKTPPKLLSLHFCRGNCPVIGLGHSVPLKMGLRKRNIARLLLRLWSIMVCSTLNLTFCQTEEWDAVYCGTSYTRPLWC
jgi:hypothetical protein